MTRATDIVCVFRIQFAGTRREVGPFLLAALVFPAAMYLFAFAVAGGEVAPQASRLRFLAGSIVFSLSLTSISWLGYLLLENRFTGRLKLFATLPLAPSSYVFGILVFGIVQAALGCSALLIVARLLGVRTQMSVWPLLVSVLLIMLCLSGLSVIIATRARSFSEGSLLTDSLGAGLVFLAPVDYSPEALPRPLQLLSRVLPTTYAARGVQTTLLGGSGVGADLVTLAIMATVSLAIGF